MKSSDNLSLVVSQEFSEALERGPQLDVIIFFNFKVYDLCGKSNFIRTKKNRETFPFLKKY